MKPQKQLLFALLLAGILCRMLACQKISTIPNSAANTDSSVIFSATIKGISWTADSVAAVLVTNDDARGKLLTISGFTANKEITISMMDSASSAFPDSSISVRQYTEGVGPETSAFLYFSDKVLVFGDSVWKYQGIAASGQANVTVSAAATKKISGSFSFSAQAITFDSTGISIDSVTISNGLFNNIPYTYQHHL